MAGSSPPLDLWRPALAGGPDWSGVWVVRWPNGSGVLTLKQDGDQVTGEMPSYDWKATGVAKRRKAPFGEDAQILTGTLADGTRNDFTLTLSRKGDTFAGFLGSGAWLAGARADPSALRERANLATPRERSASFVAFGNAWMAGRTGSGRAGRGRRRADNEKDLTPAQQVEEFRRLFQLVAQTTFEIDDVPEAAPGRPVRRDADPGRDRRRMKLTFFRQDGKWLIRYPGEAPIAAAEAALFKRSGGRPPASDAYHAQRNPRDTMRAYLEAMDAWTSGGREQVAAMLDLSNVPEASRQDEAALAAQYIKRDLVKLVPVELEAIPDDGAALEPYVHFQHPAGRIEIVPVKSPEGPVWKFSSATVDHADEIYAAVGDLPDRPPVPRQGPPPSSPFFTMREWVGNVAPSLLERFGVVARWQAIAAVALWRCASWSRSFPRSRSSKGFGSPSAARRFTIPGSFAPR